MSKHNYPTAQILGLFTGKVATPWIDKPASAIAKTAQDKPLRVLPLGLEGDEQADREAHGGPDQAVHHYAAEHMEFWRAELPRSEHVFEPGCFGENLSTMGFTEETLCIGDVLSLGTAVVQVSQGRQPCWKLDAHTGYDGMAYRFRKTVRTGWYYRVLEPGQVEPHAVMRVIERPEPEWSVAKVTEARFNPKLDKKTAALLTELSLLSTVWRTHFGKLTEA